MDLGLHNKACIVTGASRGIGLETARQLGAEGAEVLLCARDPDALDSAAHSVEAAGARVEALALDVCEPSAGERLVAACAGAFGSVDVVVNNAGTSAVRALEQLTDDDWQMQWELHVMASVRLMRAAIPSMVDQQFGRVVNVTSSSGKRPSLTNVAYSVTKAAQLSASRAFAERYASRGVLVNAVAPGPVETDLWLGEGGLADQAAAAAGSSREQALELTASKLPRGRFATDAEIASVIVFLCSTRADNVVGAAWSVDGGTVPVII